MEHVHTKDLGQNQIEFNENNLNYTYSKLYHEPRAQHLFDALEKELVYLADPKLKIRGQLLSIPRQIVAYGDPGLSYTFSGITIAARPWTPFLWQIKCDVERAACERFNFVLINRYRNGWDSISPHKDDERELKATSSIASLSLGQKRQFVFTRRGYTPMTIMLENGSLLLMKHPTNRYWLHSIPKCRGTITTRINLTFRYMIYR